MKTMLCNLEVELPELQRPCDLRNDEARVQLYTDQADRQLSQGDFSEMCQSQPGLGLP